MHETTRLNTLMVSWFAYLKIKKPVDYYKLLSWLIIIYIMIIFINIFIILIIKFIVQTCNTWYNKQFREKKIKINGKNHNIQRMILSRDGQSIILRIKLIINLTIILFIYYSITHTLSLVHYYYYFFFK
jgi:hypothetical protein